MLSGAKNAYQKLKPMAETVTHAVVEKGSELAQKAAKVKAKDLTPDKIINKLGALPLNISEAALLQTTRFLLGTTGGMVKEAAKPPYAPEMLLNQIEPYIDYTWERVEGQVTKSVLSKISAKEAAFRELRCHFWPPEPTSRWSGRWMRAKFLYAMMPADANFWKSLGDPLSVFLIALRLQPFGATPILLYLLMFCMMDRTDEYQLVNFILKFKAFAFFSGGLCVSVRLCWATLHCLYMEEKGEASYCLDNAPGSSGFFTYLVWFEPLRNILTWSAFYLLWSGRAHGGSLEIEALENARLDAADGSLDVDVDREYLRSLRNVSDEEAGVHEMMSREKSISIAEMNKAIAAHRALIERREKEAAEWEGRDEKAMIRRGGRLRFFMIYDLVVFVVVFAAFVIGAEWRVEAGVGALWLPSDGSLDVHEERARRLVWSMLFFAVFSYSLASFPFVLFEVPILGQALHGAEKTGYDQSGALAPKLSSGLLKMKIAADREREKFMQRKPKDKEKAVAIIQKHHARIERERQEKREQGLDGGAPAMAADAADAADAARAAPTVQGNQPKRAPTPTPTTAEEPQAPAGRPLEA